MVAFVSVGSQRVVAKKKGEKTSVYSHFASLTRWSLLATLLLGSSYVYAPEVNCRRAQNERMLDWAYFISECLVQQPNNQSQQSRPLADPIQHQSSHSFLYLFIMLYC